MRNSNVGLAMPRKVDGYTRVSVSDKELKTLLTSLGVTTKKALVLKAVVQNPGWKTDAIRNFACCSNVSQAADDANKKLMNFGLMIICTKPSYVAKNAVFHNWYLVQAPIEMLPVKMATNDGRY